MTQIRETGNFYMLWFSTLLRKLFTYCAANSSQFLMKMKSSLNDHQVKVVCLLRSLTFYLFISSRFSDDSVRHKLDSIKFRGLVMYRAFHHKKLFVCEINMNISRPRLAVRFLVKILNFSIGFSEGFRENKVIWSFFELITSNCKIFTTT